MTDQPGRAAWACPGCGFVVGWVDEDNNLVIWRYPKPSITIRWGVFICGCGYIHHWDEAKAPTVLDRDVAPVI